MELQPGLSHPKAVIVVDLFQETLDHLLDLLSGLNAHEWNTPTICAGWSVKDVALHLLGVEIGNIAWLRDGHRGGGTISDWAELVDYINTWNEEWVAVARRISTRFLVELLGFAGEKTIEHFRSIDPFEMGGAVSWAGPKPQPVWLDIAREYTERWHHQQHIRDAVGKPGLTEPRFLHPVLEAFAWALPHTFRDSSPPAGTSIILTITGDSGGRWTLLRGNGEWGFFQGASMDPDVEIIVDEDTAWRTFTRGIDKAQARDRIAVVGNKGLAEPVFDVVSIIA